MTSTALPIPLRRARLGRYALWQAKDFVVNVGIITLLLFGLFGFLTIMNLTTMEAWMATRHVTLPLAQKLTAFREAFMGYAMVAPIIAITGIISQDRSHGYTRFLFAKPVSPRAFYAQSLLVRAVGYLVIGVVLVACYSHYEPIPPMARVIGDLCIMFVAVGGLVFFLSSLVRVDGLLVIVLLLVASIVRDKWELVTGPKMWLTYVFPPVNHVGDLHAWMAGVNTLGSIADVPFPTKWALWNAGYGLAGVVLGLYLLRKVPLTKA